MERIDSKEKKRISGENFFSFPFFFSCRNLPLSERTRFVNARGQAVVSRENSMNLAKLCFSPRHPADTLTSIQISCAIRTYIPRGRGGGRETRGERRDVVTPSQGGTERGREPWYKFIFVPNFHALTANADCVVFTKSDVTHRCYPDDIFLAFFSLPAIRLSQPLLSRNCELRRLTHDSFPSLKSRSAEGIVEARTFFCLEILSK